LIVGPLDAGDLSVVERLIDSYAFKPYRHYRVYSRKAQSAIMKAEIASALGLRPSLATHAHDHGNEAMVIARPLAWDSTFFGVPMARIDYIVASPAAPAAVVEAAVDGALAACDRAAIPHVTARLDVEDIAGVDVLERRGFRLMDALVTYRMRPRKEHPTDVREVGVIRDFAPPDADAVLEIAREAFSGYKGRFQHDPHVPAERAEAFYLEWARKCMSREMADKLLVSVNSEGRLIGFLFFRRREPASTVGRVPILGGGLGACRRDSPGAYAGLIREATIWSHQQGGIGEYQTQNYNFPVIRVYEAAGAHYVRAEYTLHAWRGAAAEIEGSKCP
jgi:hypothetical protein